MSCQPRLTSLSFPRVYYRSSPLLGGQSTKANELHLPGISLAMLCQLPAVALSFWLVCRGYHVEVEVGLGVCATVFCPVWSSRIPPCSDYVDSIYLPTVKCLRSKKAFFCVTHFLWRSQDCYKHELKFFHPNFWGYFWVYNCGVCMRDDTKTILETFQICYWHVCFCVLCLIASLYYSYFILYVAVSSPSVSIVSSFILTYITIFYLF